VNVVFDRSFSKSIDRVNSSAVRKKLESVILSIEKAKTLHEIPGLKKMEGFKTFYRVRIGEYRLGMELVDGNIFRIIIIANRKDIYRLFP